MYAFYRSARETGGDYYDFFPMDRERLALVVADASQQGLGGAMVMASVRTLFRVLGPQSSTISEALKKTNYHVARDVMRGSFVTAMLAILNVRTRELQVGSAGHNPMVVWRERTGDYTIVQPNGIALGFDRGPVFDRTLKEETVQLEVGDRVVMFTDGVVEAMNRSGEQYSCERLHEFFRHNSRLASRDLTRKLVADVDGHTGSAEQHDDATFVTVRVVG